MIAKRQKRRFDLGQIVATPGAIEALEDAEQTPVEFLSRHVAGDWGTVDAEYKRLNDEAIEIGSRILSAYVTKADVKLWVITEADRSSTCILLPSEY